VGETAKFVVQSPVADGWALVALEGEALRKPELIRFKGSSFTYQTTITPDMQPNGYLSVTIVGKGEYHSDTAGFLVPPNQKFLQVSIASDKPAYQPGEVATYTVKVTDRAGKPVQTQLALGLVDEAIYLVRAEKTEDIRGFFWDFRENIVATETAANFSFSRVNTVDLAGPVPAYLANKSSEEPFEENSVYAQGKASKLADPTLRQDFRDTILWLPAVQTDALGEAVVKAKLPDNLTEWRMTARAISKNDSMGQGVQSITSTLPVIARLAAPRFLVKDDTADLTVIGQNNLPEQQSGETRLKAEGLTLNTSAKAVVFPAGGRTATSYTVKAGSSTAATLEASVLTPAASDALRRTLPVLPKGIKEEIAWSGESSPQASADWNFSVPAEQAKAKVYLNPSLVATVAPALAYLVGYPYGCSEQTMSRFLPSVLAKQTGVPQASLQGNLDEFVAEGLKRLYSFQHGDGGWGFWENDSSSLFISSYVISGLAQAQKAGYSVRRSVLDSGVGYLSLTLSRPDIQSFSSDAVAYGVYAAALAVPYTTANTARVAGVTPPPIPGSKDVFPKSLQRAVQAKDITPYGQALGVLAYLELGDKPAAESLLDKLLSTLVQRDRTAYWQVKANPYAWNDDEIEATARGLEALAKIRPSHSVIPKIVNWLMLQRKGAKWVSTKDTAAVVVAALELAKARGEQNQQEVRVTLGGKEQTLSIGPSGAELDLQVQPGANALNVQSSGPLYVSASVGYFEEKPYLTPEYKGFRVARQYEKLTPRFDAKNDRYVYDRTPVTKLNIGDLVVVTLTVRPDTKNARYVLLEEPTPAGFSVVENDSSFRIAGVKSRFGDDYYGWNYWFDGREIRDSRIEFYFSYLSGPVTFTYILRAETAGSFTALPSVAWMMYEPEVRGVGTVRQMDIGK
jgi:alpha-2-macroglobulin